MTEISREMIAAGESSSTFQMKDLRRTVETMLAATQVAKDVRSLVMSHGISGVQATHYDRHDYLQEKRHAVTTWERKLTVIQGVAPAKVVPIRLEAR